MTALKLYVMQFHNCYYHIITEAQKFELYNIVAKYVTNCTIHRYIFFYKINS